jgi:uncharacterized protein (DUF302 family)
MSNTYAFGKTVGTEVSQTIERVTQALAKEGFGILSDIDVAGTLKKKLGIEVPAYRILGACNPQFAHRAIEAEPEIGTLLPCNVVVRKISAGTRVDIMDPLAVMQLVGKPEVATIASEVRGRLQRVLGEI